MSRDDEWYRSVNGSSQTLKVLDIDLTCLMALEISSSSSSHSSSSLLPENNGLGMMSWFLLLGVVRPATTDPRALTDVEGVIWWNLAEADRL